MKTKIEYQEFGVKVVPVSFDDFEDPNDDEYWLEQIQAREDLAEEDLETDLTWWDDEK